MHLDNLTRFLSAVGPYIDIIVFGDDLGMQTGPQISPRMYASIFQPHEKIMWETAKRLADVKVMLHSCGGLYPLLPGLIEAGLDILQPVQTTCRDMEPERLKREFGRDLCLWGGGCDTRDVLPGATPEQVVRRRARAGECVCPRRRVRVPAGSQHHGRRAATECHRHARRRERLLNESCCAGVSMFVQLQLALSS